MAEGNIFGSGLANMDIALSNAAHLTKNSYMWRSDIVVVGNQFDTIGRLQRQLAEVIKRRAWPSDSIIKNYNQNLD